LTATSQTTTNNNNNNMEAANKDLNLLGKHLGLVLDKRLFDKCKMVIGKLICCFIDDKEGEGEGWIKARIVDLVLDTEMLVSSLDYVPACSYLVSPTCVIFWIQQFVTGTQHEGLYELIFANAPSPPFILVNHRGLAGNNIGEVVDTSSYRMLLFLLFGLSLLPHAVDFYDCSHVAFLEGDKVSIISANLEFDNGTVIKSCTDNKVATIWSRNPQGTAVGDRFALPLSRLLVYQNGPLPTKPHGPCSDLDLFGTVVNPLVKWEDGLMLTMAEDKPRSYAGYFLTSNTNQATQIFTAMLDVAHSIYRKPTSAPLD
jgi:hypothetical protein